MTAFNALGPDGALAKQIKNFAVRPSQQEMAAIIDEHIAEQHSIVIEAGTGIGKTFAYLVPALLSGLKIIVSTGTKTLQEQLFLRDLPLVKKALKIPASLALLKGRANYLCLYRLRTARQSGANLHPYLVDEIEDVHDWSQRTQSGDIVELNQISEKSTVWPHVTSTVENCLGQQCSDYDDCFLLKARRDAQTADVLVINHHLLMADLLLKESGFGDLLPKANAIIVDEAHQLPDVATHFFGHSINQKQIRELVEDVESEFRIIELLALQYRGEKASLDKRCKDPKQQLLIDIKKTLADHYHSLPNRVGRFLSSEIKNLPRIVENLESLNSLLEKMRDFLVSIESPSKTIDNCSSRCYGLISQIEKLIESIKNSSNPVDECELQFDSVAWLERTQSGFSWNISPIDISEEYLSKTEIYQSTWIYTSATLAIGDSFQHFSDRLGIEPDKTAIIDSPFDYQNQALLYLPQNMPAPNTADYTSAVIDLSEQLAKHCRGGLFILFTSHKALKFAAERIRPKLNRPLLVQGDSPRSDLLFRFQEIGNAILLGTSSFWQGVDVRGQALSCVVIDKLPFASPGDPLVQAKIEFCRSKGQNPFMSFQLPDAIINLKQGVGRLIRDYQDYGLMVLCDPRISTKPYGKKFLDSLPDMNRTNSEQEAIEFLSQLDDLTRKVESEDSAVSESLEE